MQEKYTVRSLIKDMYENYEKKNYHGLLQTVSMLLSKDPNNGEFLLYKLKALDGLDLLASDLAFLQHYVRMRSTDTTGFILLYKFYLEHGEIANAIISLVYALSIEPEDQQFISLLRPLLSEINPDFVRVKINIMSTKRIGHLACEIEPLLRSNQYKKDDCLQLFICEVGTVANTYLFDLLKTYTNIIENNFWLDLYLSRPLLLSDEFHQLFPYDVNAGRRGFNSVEIGTQGYKNLINIYRDFPQYITIPVEDIQFGWEILDQYNITRESKIVCLHVRDSAYLSEQYPGNDFSYHDFRDVKIETYQPAIEYLLKQGYTIIRIGSKTNQFLNISSPNYFDFCKDPHKDYSEFLEVFLLQICDFFIATSSGPFGIAAMFDTPTLVVNSTPYNHPYMKYSRFIPKKLFQFNKAINFIDICAGKPISTQNEKPLMLLTSKKEFEGEGYYHIDNSSEDIYHAVVEFSAQVNNRVFNAEFTQKQKEYVALLPDNFIFKDCASVVCDSFLQRYPDIFINKVK